MSMPQDPILPAAVEALNKSADAVPNPGSVSVTQSSNTNDAGVTTDQVKVTAEYGATRPSFSVTNGDQWSITSNDDIVRTLTGNSVLTPPWKGVHLLKKLPDGGLIVRVYTNIEAPRAGQPDADYLSHGTWVYGPDTVSNTDDYQFGAFATGSDPFTQANIMALTGTATYAGDAIGGYSLKEASSTPAVGVFNADVSLTANFGATDSLGTIEGSITNFELEGESTEGTLNLGEAAISNANSGFFNGSVTGSVTGETGEHTLNGKWGGQFFGNGAASTDHPGSVAGTFSGSSADDATNFVGAIGAFKE